MLISCNENCVPWLCLAHAVRKAYSGICRSHPARLLKQTLQLMVAPSRTRGHGTEHLETPTGGSCPARPQELLVPGAVTAPSPPSQLRHRDNPPPRFTLHPHGDVQPSPSPQGCTAWAGITIKHPYFCFAISLFYDFFPLMWLITR